jgi:predicted GH43/DUF377 family glycosyl hydrolase
MHEKYLGVALDWKKAVRGSQNPIFTNTIMFRYKPRLVVQVANVFNNSVTENQIKLAILKRKSTTVRLLPR